MDGHTYIGLNYCQVRDLLGGDYYVNAGNLNDPKARLRVGYDFKPVYKDRVRLGIRGSTLNVLNEFYFTDVSNQANSNTSGLDQYALRKVGDCSDAIYFVTSTVRKGSSTICASGGGAFPMI